MRQEKKREIHPIVREALELAYIGAEPVAFTDWAIEELKQSLEQYFGQPDLIKAVVDLINLAGLLREQGSPTAAIAIIEVVSIATDALEELKKDPK
ncbi:MAG TPA: hypothetical protein VMV49_12225 [Candidatus Deferrimicrobium sp.]|nr:hypothetical protein [Candidatus Deferrimicrobium sp.]